MSVDEDDLFEIGFALGAIGGVVYGVIEGFREHGIGGAILFGLLGALGGGFAGAIVLRLAVLGIFLALVVGGAALVIYGFWLLWDLGKP